MVLILAAALASAASLEDVLVTELNRADQTLSKRPEKPHYVALVITDQHSWNINARSGALAQSDETDERLLDIDLRVGTPERDSTHELRGFSALENDSRDRNRLPRVH